jgi:hypothetical protein
MIYVVLVLAVWLAFGLYSARLYYGEFFNQFGETSSVDSLIIPTIISGPIALVSIKFIFSDVKVNWSGPLGNEYDPAASPHYRLNTFNPPRGLARLITTGMNLPTEADEHPKAREDNLWLDKVLGRQR